MFTQDTLDYAQFVTAKMTPEQVFEIAADRARKAVDAFVEQHGEPMYCGFGWVKIRPARGKFVSYLKSADIGRTSFTGGYDINFHDIMGNHPMRYTQSMDIKEVACDEFAKVIKVYGVTCYSQSRAD